MITTLDKSDVINRDFHYVFMGLSLEKRALLKKLKDTYCRLRPSRISGIGVFAIRDIPKGINPFRGPKPPKWIKFNMGELKGLGESVTDMIRDFYVVEKSGTVFVPNIALNGMDISFFVNNSKTPNLITPDDGLTFITKRNIGKGEELTVEYVSYAKER